MRSGRKQPETDQHDDGGAARRGRRRRRIILSELALTVTMTLTGVLGLLHREALDSQGLFLAGWGLNLLVLALCSVLPWSRIPGRWVIVVPLVDLVAIGLVLEGAGETFGGVGLLAAFPVVWIAASRIRTSTAVALTVVASFALLWLPLVLRGDPLDVGTAIEPILLPVMLVGLAIFVSALSAENRRRQEALEASRAALRESVEAGRARERILTTILNTVHAGLLAVDADGHDILMNSRQRAAHTLATPLKNQDPEETELLIFGSDRVTPVPPEERPVRRAIQGEDLESVQVWVGPPRSQRAVSVSSQAMRDDDGSFAGTVVSFNDVTELVVALGAKDDFLSNVSHEFRTPLTSILGYLELSLEFGDSLPDGVAGYLEVARRNAMRLEQLVEDLLAINAETFEVSPVQADVSRVLVEATSSAQVRATRAGLRLMNRAPAALPAVVDPNRLAQAVDNLLSNAVKYNRPGGSITLDASLDDGVLRIDVEDTGIGIDAEELHRVFERFFRSPSVRTSTVPGVGLGLLITKSIVREHGGSITVTSQPGEGSCFTITIPQPAA